LLLVHTSDLHLVPEQFQKSILEEAYIATLREVIDIAAREGSKYILISGDMFDYIYEPPDVLIKVVRELKKLREAGIRVIAAPGNHDFSPTKKSVLNLLHEAGLIYLTPQELFADWLVLDPLIFEDDKLAFYGIPGFRGMSNKEVEYLKMNKVKFKKARELAGYNLVVLAHINTKFEGYDPSRYAKRYGALYLEYEDFFERLPENTRYVALGHIHLPIPLGEVFKAKMAYPGAPIGIDLSDFKETVLLEKMGGYRRALLVDIDEEPPLLRSIRLESSPRVYHWVIEARSSEELRVEAKRLLDAVDTSKLAIAIFEVKGLEAPAMEGPLQDLIKAYSKKGVYVRIKPVAEALEEEVYVPIVDIEAEAKKLSIEELEERVIVEYLAKKRVEIPPEKIRWVINYLSQDIGSNVEKAIREILEELGERS
jgi:DNA repair exonuclease SbcCD nuclease subunit